MIQSVSSSNQVASVQRPQLPKDAKVDAVAPTTRKAGADSTEFSSAALKLLAGEAGET